MEPQHDHSHEQILTFNDFTADELAEHALNVFLFQGRHLLGAQLIYHALCLEPSNALALRCLSDLLDQKGMEVFSAITLEYALLYADHEDIETLKTFENMLFCAKWSWGFSRHQSGGVNLKLDDFQDRSQFSLDEDRYFDFINTVLNHAALHHSDDQNNLMASFACAKRLCGIMAQFLIHQEADKTYVFDALFDQHDFIETPTYAQWLKTYEPVLDQLAEKRMLAQFQTMQGDENT